MMVSSKKDHKQNLQPWMWVLLGTVVFLFVAALTWGRA